MAEYLLANETMSGEDFDYFCEHGTLPVSEKSGEVIASEQERPAEGDTEEVSEAVSEEVSEEISEETAEASEETEE